MKPISVLGPIRFLSTKMYTGLQFGDSTSVNIRNPILLSFNMRMPKPRESDIAFIVKDIIMYKLGLEQSQLQDSAHLQDDLGIDSLDIIELLMEIQSKFGINISDEEAEKMKTVASIIRCVQRKML